MYVWCHLELPVYTTAELERDSIEFDGILQKGPYPPFLHMAVGPFWQGILMMTSHIIVYIGKHLCRKTKSMA